MKKNYTILAIDTSCDETAAAVTIDERIVSNIISSQVELHKKWGGVVPILAQRAHRQRIDAVISEALKRAKKNMSELDALAVTVGPGLAPALEVGVKYAKNLSVAHKKPLIAVNHMEGHLLSPFAKNSKGDNHNGAKINSVSFPLLGLLVSGGHTELVLVDSIGSYTLIGETLDDALGEAFDKVSKLLDLGYPGGPIIEELAKKGNEHAYNLPIPMHGRKDFNFSYSGLKTAVRYLTRDLKKKNEFNKNAIVDICASFQRVASASLVDRLIRAVDRYKPNGVLLGGGVISNAYIRRNIRRAMKPYGISIYVPFLKNLYTDNAAMIGIAGYFQAKRNEFVNKIGMLDRLPNLRFTKKK